MSEVTVPPESPSPYMDTGGGEAMLVEVEVEMEEEEEEMDEVSLSELPLDGPNIPIDFKFTSRLQEMRAHPVASPKVSIMLAQSVSLSAKCWLPATNESENPRVKPLRLPTPEEIRGQYIWNNCAVRSVISGVMGGGLGLVMGIFLGALDNPIMQDEMSGRHQFIYTAKQMGCRSWNSCKLFAVMGFVFHATECVVEKARAKHDMTNTVVASCITGGTMSARGGPKAACVGCAEFATFLVLIEKFLDMHN